MKRTSTLGKAVVTGLVLNALSGLSGIPTLVMPHAGPAPFVINIVTGVLGIVTLVGVVTVWRARRQGSPLGVWLIVVSQVLNVLTAVPAFFADLDPTYKALIAVGVVLTVAAIWLVLPARRPAIAAGSAAPAVA